jgi:hypothetical protein
VHVTVVANSWSLSRRLRMAAAEVIYFDELPPAVGAMLHPKAA